MNTNSKSDAYAAAGEFACDIVRKFTEGEYSEVVFVYNHFVSTSRQEVVVERYLPLPAEDVTDDVTEIKDEYNPYIEFKIKIKIRSINKNRPNF